MQKINLTDAEANQLKTLLPMRIERLQGWNTPEQMRRSMWPVEPSADMLKEYTVRHERRQRNIKLYQSILKKLGA